MLELSLVKELSRFLPLYFYPHTLPDLTVDQHCGVLLHVYV